MKLVSHERKREGARDDWETPRALFDRFNDVYRFTCDVAANAKNSLCEVHLGPGGFFEDALTCEHWSTRNWCNPPFALWPEFAARCVEQANFGCLTAFLVPPRIDTAAYHDILSQASEHIMIRGRIQFTLDGKRPQHTNKAGKLVDSGNGAGSMVAIFSPRVKGVKYGNPRLCFMDMREQ